MAMNYECNAVIFGLWSFEYEMLAVIFGLWSFGYELLYESFGLWSFERVAYCFFEEGIFQGSIEDKIDESLSKERMSSKALKPLAHEVTD